MLYIQTNKMIFFHQSMPNTTQHGCALAQRCVWILRCKKYHFFHIKHQPAVGKLKSVPNKLSDSDPKDPAA